MPTALSNDPAVLTDFTGAPQARPGYAGKCSRCNTDACGPRAGEYVYRLAEIDQEGPFEVGGRCLKELIGIPDPVTGEAWAEERQALHAAIASGDKTQAHLRGQRDALTELIAELNAEVAKAQDEAADAYARGFEDGRLPEEDEAPAEVEEP